eukprot:982864-Prorocentrum_minimum.AAC.1
MGAQRGSHQLVLPDGPPVVVGCVGGHYARGSRGGHRGVYRGSQGGHKGVTWRSRGCPEEVEPAGASRRAPSGVQGP